MGYYSYKSNNTGWAGLIIAIILFFAIMLGQNSCTETDWNGGICPSCETRYELRGASRGLKYYACPDCGFEVERY